MENSAPIVFSKLWNKLPLSIRNSYKNTNKHLSEMKEFVSNLKDSQEEGIRLNSLDARIDQFYGERISLGLKSHR